MRQGQGKRRERWPVPLTILPIRWLDHRQQHTPA